MTVDIIQVPNVIELSLYNEERKTALLQEMFNQYVERIEELTKYAPQNVIDIANDNANVIAKEIEEGDYLKFYPWKLYKFYQDIRSHYSDLVVMVGKYKQFVENQEKYHIQIEEKIETIIRIEKYIGDHEEISKLFDEAPVSWIVKSKDVLLAKEYSQKSFKTLYDECEGTIKDYLDIINTFKEQKTEQEATGIDAVIAKAKNQGQQEQKDATDKATEGVDMFKRLQNLRNQSGD